MILVLVLFAAPAALAWAGGTQEAEAAPETATTAEAEAETTNDQEGPSASRDGSGQDGTDGSGSAAESAISGDLRSALRNAGLQPLDQRVPSEDFSLGILDGSQRNLESFQGNVVLLNFWASWCGPCVEEMPAMQTLYEDLQDDNFSIVAVNVQEGQSVVQSFVDQHGFTYPILMDPTGRTARRYGVRGLPTSYLIAPNGDIIAAKVGYHDWDTEGVRTAIDRVLQEL
jgi:thiol-disulfide isomerase/thioredoxin